MPSRIAIIQAYVQLATRKGVMPSKFIARLPARTFHLDRMQATAFPKRFRFGWRVIVGVRRIIGVAVLLPSIALAQSIALTFDDGLDPRQQPQAASWNKAILDALGRGGVPIAI
jgi:hypothetical protein